MLLNCCDVIPGIGPVHALRRRSFARQIVVGRNRTGDDVRFQSGQLNLDVGDSVNRTDGIIGHSPTFSNDRFDKVRYPAKGDPSGPQFGFCKGRN
jgi:hypothetical protein